jgi:hypothetical protein
VEPGNAAENQSESLRLPAAILEAEETIRNGELETILIFDETGNLILSKECEEDSIQLTPDEIALAFGYGKIVSHNHPHDAVPIEVSFSPTDIEAACRYGLSEMRVVAPAGATFSMRPQASGWNQEYWNTVLEPTIEKYALLIDILQQGEIEAGVLDEQTAARIGWGRVWPFVAAELGLTYQHTVQGQIVSSLENDRAMIDSRLT